MSYLSKVQYIVNQDGHAVYAVLPIDAWEELLSHLPSSVDAKTRPCPTPSQSPKVLRDFKDFLQCWDFAYAYDPAVRCPHCGATVADWRTDSKHTFILTNASFGGLLVFHCCVCGTTIRHKHFTDHVALEHSTPRA